MYEFLKNWLAITDLISIDPTIFSRISGITFETFFKRNLFNVVLKEALRLYGSNLVAQSKTVSQHL